MTLNKECENGDGIGQMVFLEHTFCWCCYYRYMKSMYGLGGVVICDTENQANELENEKQMRLFS
jgi:hypothetical protein